MAEKLLVVKDLRVDYPTDDGVAHIVNGVSFDIGPGETLGLVGETGAGKSTTVMALVGLLRGADHSMSGEIVFDGVDLARLSEAELNRVRGKDISLIMQNARSALDPLTRVGKQIAEVFRTHTDASAGEAEAKALEMIGLVRIPDPERVAEARPFELSGGMAQRVMIAMALVCSPKLVIADEPTTGLDVTVQRGILELTRELVARDGRGLLIVTHDLGVVARYCNRVAVMYAGRIVEHSDVRTFFGNARHPYSISLLGAASYDPELVARTSRSGRETMFLDLTNLPSGCHFHPNCRLVEDRCRQVDPPLEEVADGHFVRCFAAQTSRGRIYDEPA